MARTVGSFAEVTRQRIFLSFEGIEAQHRQFHVSSISESEGSAVPLHHLTNGSSGGDSTLFGRAEIFSYMLQEVLLGHLLLAYQAPNWGGCAHKKGANSDGQSEWPLVVGQQIFFDSASSGDELRKDFPIIVEAG